jgi:hypothetical protein
LSKLLPVSLALALSVPLVAAAETTPEIQALRQEIEAIRSAYEARLDALEQRLRAAEAAAASAAATPPPAAPAAAVPAAPGGGANSFNPSLSLILSGTYARTTRDPATYSIAGFPLPARAQVGPGTRGLSLGETELGLAANVDPWLRGAANIALEPDNAVSIEEAFIETTSLGNGLTVKAGRFFSGVGYLNPQHSHAWDFVDAPLAYQAMLGTQYNDDGVRVAWLAPTEHYIEVAAELGRGLSFPGSEPGGNGSGMWSLAAHSGGDIGASSSWRAGVSVLSAKATDQALVATDSLGNATTSVFNGSARVWIADAIWKWAPNGNATRTSLKLQGEILRSTRSGTFADGDGNPLAGPGAQSGWYLQAVYQLLPAWRVGLRTERLDPGSAKGDGLQPRKDTLMVDFNPSEFSRVRLQFAQDRARGGDPDRQVFLQYQMSLGAHGAHSY